MEIPIPLQPEVYIFIDQDSDNTPSKVVWIDFPEKGRGQEKGHRMGLRVRKAEDRARREKEERMQVGRRAGWASRTGLWWVP